MRFHSIFMATGISLALVACGSSADEKPRKGKYKAEASVTQLKMEGLPENLQATMKTQMESSMKAQTSAEQCLAGNKKDDWKQAAEGLSKGMGGKCETVRDNGTDSSVDTEIRCTGTQLGDMTVTMKGEAQSESFGMDMNMKIDKLPMPNGGAGEIGVKFTANRVGDC